MGRNEVIARDAILYIKSAKLYSVGNYVEGFNLFPRSIFPLFIVFAQKIFGDWVRAGQWVSTFFGALAVVPLYLLARRIFNEKIALVGAFFYILCPSLVRDSAEVLRETPFIFFYITALWLGYEGIREKRVWVIGLTGVLILLACSIKDYGIMLFISLILFLCWYLVKRQVAPGKAFLLCFTLLASVIVVFILLGIDLGYKGFNIRAPILSRAESGFMGVTHQGATISGLKREMEGLEFSQRGKRLFDLAVDNRFALYSYHFLKKMVYAFNIILFILFLFGLIRRRIIPYRMDEFLLFTIYAVYFPLVFLYLSYTFFLQTKSIFPLLVPSLIWSGVGFEEVKERVTDWLRRQSILSKRLEVQHTGFLILILIAISMLALAWAPHRKDKMGFKEIGTWLKNNGYAHSIIVGQEDFDRLAFYADSEFIQLPKGKYEEIIKFARERKANLLIIDKMAIDRLGSHFFDRISPQDLEPIKLTGIRASQNGMMVFRVIDQKE